MALSSHSSTPLSPETLGRLQKMRNASRGLRLSSAAERNRVLENLVASLTRDQDRILEANALDLTRLSRSGSGAAPETSDRNTVAFRDRLTLNSERLLQMQDSLLKVRSLEDPLGEVTFEKTLPNGLLLKQVRSPLGVILMIFEARPNVITEAFSLALKSGNALILRGGSESLETSRVLYELIDSSLQSSPLGKDIFWGVTDPNRALSQALMKQNRWIDVLVPRGGDRLIEYVTSNATIPIIKNDRGLCHVYVHEDADPIKTVEIVYNAKVQRPGVCNSMETLLIHQNQKSLLPRIYERLMKTPRGQGVQWFGCEETLRVLAGRTQIQLAREDNYDTEYLDDKLNCRIVDSLEMALEHIELHGSRHSEAILTESESTARRFQDSVDAAVTYWNASTRFTDGYQFGLGGELGISTQKLHVRGPVGLKELTSLRWLVDGKGQIRE